MEKRLSDKNKVRSNKLMQQFQESVNNQTDVNEIIETLDQKKRRLMGEFLNSQEQID